jgi:acyl carrier protein
MEKLTEIHRRVLRRPDLVLHPGLTAREVDTWDSLAHLQLIIAVEKAFAVTFTPDEFAGLSCFGDLLRLLQQKGCAIE